MNRSAIVVFIRREPVLSISWVLALISMAFVLPSPSYVQYIDWKVLGCLFALMLVVAGFRKMYFFTKFSTVLLRYAHTPRQVASMLVGLTFFTSMAITNDVALITFVPLTIVVFSLCNEQKPILMTVVLQTVAANVGSSLTPVGNPQNLFLYSYYALPVKTFLLTMFPLVLSGALLLGFLLLLIPSRSKDFQLHVQEVPPLDKKKLLRYLFLFLLSLAAVFNVLPWYLAVVVVILFSEKILLKNVDYSLLLTFIGFFVFVGNLGELEHVRLALQRLLQGRVFLTSLVASQIISNVPATLLLSQFTQNSRDLLLGVNAGGCGTLIASMASVISFTCYSHYKPSDAGRYLFAFTWVNMLFVALFVVVWVVL
ncbi:MAG: citrate transporter [Spirochaetia bacterium]|nr:citrate transporter [Spirochaetia bacterium]